MADLNFKQGIKSVLTKLAPNFTLTKDGIDLLNRILQRLNSKLVKNCLDHTKDIIDVTIARNAVDALFSGKLKRLALAEGNRILALYGNGMVEYQPKYHAKRKKAKKALATAALEFSRGVIELTSNIFTEVSLQDGCKTILCELLEELAVKVSDIVQYKKNIITENDIRVAISTVLPQELSRHALAEGARMILLFETGILQESARKRSAVDKRKLEAGILQEPDRKRSAVRKRKRSPFEETPRTKRPRKRSATKVSRKKATRKTSRRKAIREVSRKKSVSPKRIHEAIPSGEGKHKVSREKRRSRKTLPQKTVSKKTPKKVSRKQAASKGSRRARSRKRSVSRKKKSAARKKPIRVSPKTVRKVSRKKTAKETLVSEKVTVSKITTTTAKEMNRGTRILNKSYRQKLPAQSSSIIVNCLSNLLQDLIAEMKKAKSSIIGPQEVRRSVIKVFPPQLADLAIAHMSQVIMNLT